MNTTKLLGKQPDRMLRETCDILAFFFVHLVLLFCSLLASYAVTFLSWFPRQLKQIPRQVLKNHDEVVFLYLGVLPRLSEIVLKQFYSSKS